MAAWVKMLLGLAVLAGGALIIPGCTPSTATNSRESYSGCGTPGGGAVGYSRVRRR